MAATICFPVGNLAPEGSVIKSTSIDASLIDAQDGGAGLLHGGSGDRGDPGRRGGLGDVIVLIYGGPAGAGMQAIYQVTSALKNCRSVAMWRADGCAL